jgi:hypothetical protein
MRFAVPPYGIEYLDVVSIAWKCRWNAGDFFNI